MKKLFLVFGVIFFQVNVYAQSSDGLISVRGTGNISCGDYVTFEGNKPQLDVVNQWVWGFMVAYQMRGQFGKKYTLPQSGNISSLPEAATIQLYLKKYCNDNPLSSVLNGSMHLIKDSGGLVANLK
jgi:hypothetical protein